MKTDRKMLFIGNSFSDDTMEHVANILLSLGVTSVSLGNLYIGGCSINRHVDNAANDRAWYEYRTNTGDGWTTTPNTSIRAAVTSQDWDVIAIQSGTADGSRNTCERCYENLPILTAYIRALCKNTPTIVFNMTWVGEAWNGHPEIVAFDGDQAAMYREVTRIAKEFVSPLVDVVSPAGTAIQNARAVGLSPLNRDGYHLSWGPGRYIAGLTFVGAATGLDLRGVTWCPEGVNEAQKALAVKAASEALQTPFDVTASAPLMDGFVSDTAAGSANQTLFESDKQWHTARVYYTLTAGGDTYSLLFSGAVDSTFDDGSRSVCNVMCSGWKLRDLRMGLCTHSAMDEAVEPALWAAVTFGGETEIEIEANAWVQTDPVVLHAKAGDVLCVEYAFCGEVLPCHEELWVASFVDGIPSVQLPVPSRVAVKREAVRVAFLGDSITQGIGSTKNSYRHWAALTANALGDKYAFWNLGIGYARSGDAASDGAWLRKVKENEIVVLCLGVNDLLRGFTAEDVCENLRRIVKILRSRGIRVLVQTVPPFEGLGAARGQVNDYIKTTLVCDGVFDNGFMAARDGAPLYGGHPNDEGCALWAEKLTVWLRGMLVCEL